MRSRTAPTVACIVSGGFDRTLKVWDARPSAKSCRWAGTRTSCLPFKLAYSPDGSRIVSGSNDKTLKIWDARTGQDLLTLEGHTNGVRGVAYSPDGLRIFSAGLDKTTKVWDVGVGQNFHYLKAASGPP